jgi:hypothetical protein
LLETIRAKNFPRAVKERLVDKNAPGKNGRAAMNSGDARKSGLSL